VEVVDYPALSQEVDITARYKAGCQKLFDNGCTVVLFWEDDDWYASNYIETMVTRWIESGKPAAIGIGISTYYHIMTNRYFSIRHTGRASAMATLVTKKVMDIQWPADNDPYLDIALWKQLKGKTFEPEKPICLGIKHNLGMVGGGAHQPDSGHYKIEDKDGSYLRSIVGRDFTFYSEMKDAALQ
jgi:hypothetical protein